MKKLLFAMAVALLTFASCSNEELVKEVPNQYGRITATIEQGETNSRLAINQDNTLSWTEGDKIRIFMSDGQTTYDYKYTANGDFEPAEIGNEIPANTTDNDVLGVYTLGSDDDGDYGDGSVEGNTLYSGFQQNTVLASGAENRIILPMWGTWNNGTISFKHLAAVLRVNLTDLPEEYDLLAIITDQPISGNAYVEDVTVPNAVMEMDDDYTADGDHNLITIEFENASARTLYVPLPVNTYGSIQVIVAKGEEDEGQFVDPIYLANYTNKIVQRAYIYNASPTIQQTGVTIPADVTFTSSTQQSVALTEQIDATDANAGSISIPTTLLNLNLDFEVSPKTDSTAPLKIESNTDAAVGDATQGLNIGMPEDAEDIYMDIDAPTTTATLNGGTYAQVTAKTANNTLVIGEGTTVTKAIIKGGNVRVYGTLSAIELDGADDVKIYKESGATVPTTLPTGVTVINVAEKAFRDAIDAASGTVYLESDVDLESSIVITKDVEIDLNGHTITCETSDVFVVTDGTLTITGGTVWSSVNNTGSSSAIWVNGANAKAIINGGTYKVGGDINSDDKRNDCIYVGSEGGTIEIYNGEFQYTGDVASGDEGTNKDGNRFLVNQKNSHTQQLITIYGGIFHSFDPSNAKTDDGWMTGGVGSYIADGRSVVKEDNRYMVCEIMDEGMLTQAVAAGGIITLAGDIDLGQTIEITKDVTINLNGHYVKCQPMDVFKVTSGTLTLNGEGTVWGSESNTGNSCAIWENGADAKAIINGGSYKVGGDINSDDKRNDCIYVGSEGGTIEIYNGEFQYTGDVASGDEGTNKDGNRFLVNQNNSLTQQHITIYGGKFHKFDPSNAKTDDDWMTNDVGSYLETGYTIMQTGDIYEVLPTN